MGVLTGSAAVAAFTVWGFYVGLGEDVPLSVKVLLVSLVVAIALIVALFDQLRLARKQYQEAVAAIYKHHPLLDDGIDVQAISTYSATAVGIARGQGLIGRAGSDARDIQIRVDARSGKVLLFTCSEGDIKTVMAYISPIESKDNNKDRKTIFGRVLTPSMFEVDPRGESGDLWVLVYSKEDNVRIATIEWRDAHISQ